MRCHFIWDKEIGRVFIPGCWASIHQEDARNCTCRPETFHQFEKEIYNQKLQEMQYQIKDQEKYIHLLHRILRRVNGFKNERFYYKKNPDKRRPDPRVRALPQE